MPDWTVTENDLRYAAYKRCPCGAGLAYVPAWYDQPDSPAYRVWDCSAILLDTAPHKGQEGATEHCAQYPFIFYEILPEDQPSARGATTRPNVAKEAS